MKVTSNPSRFVKLACLSAAVSVASAFAIARRPGNSPAKVDSAKRPATTVPATQATRRIANMESELITITPHGFEPREITRPSGKFLLMVDNRSGQLMSPSLRTDSPVTPALIRGLNVTREQPNWSDFIDLLPGSYILTEPSHPSWTCRITIRVQ